MTDNKKYLGPGNISKTFKELRELVGHHFDAAPSCSTCGMPESICRCPEPEIKPFLISSKGWKLFLNIITDDQGFILYYSIWRAYNYKDRRKWLNKNKICYGVGMTIQEAHKDFLEKSNQ